jgi:threonylcarbamoyladenosine tRNA methylthiotransferase MtaB
LRCKPQLHRCENDCTQGKLDSPVPTTGTKPIAYNNTVARFYVENFGCRATQADGAAMERALQERGLTPAGGSQDAEIVVLNTCTVTASADQDVRAAIRRIHRGNPGCRILVTGCYAQRAPQEIAALPGVSAVVGNSHKGVIAQIICGDEWAAPASPAGILPQVPTAGTLRGAQGRLWGTVAAGAPCPPGFAGRGNEASAEIYVGDIFAHTELEGAPVFEAGGKTRPNLKVQDGCNNRCSFCIIPAVRGPSRSLKFAEVVREVQALVGAGYREVVLSGINLGRWGRDLPGRPRFEHLVRALLEDTAVEKLRLSSIEPMDWSDELIALMAASSRIAKHAHVPLQSGSDRILRRMYRKYRPWHYADRVHKIRAALPTAAIGADVMVGFPGESGRDFEATRALVEQLPLTYLHVFSYSSRPGTRSAQMPETIPVPVIKQRNRILRELAARKKLAFLRSFVGQTVTAITLNVYEDGCTEALTDNYLKLRLPGQHPANRWIAALVRSATSDGLGGVLAEES